MRNTQRLVMRLPTLCISQSAEWGIMKWKQTLTAAIAALLLQIPGESQAFDCPLYLAEAQTAIEKAEESIQRMQGGMPVASLSHLLHAKMSLAEAEYHHTEENGHHHARAIVRANESRGHALAAYILSQKGNGQ